MTTLHEAQEDYIKRWRKNAEQHFYDGDYDWAASLVQKAGAQRILEIGCGVGYSTLALANRGIQALSIDTILEAVDDTSKLLKSFGFSADILDEGATKPGMFLKQIDVIENFQEISTYIQWVDLILICNPGGKLEVDLTKNEIEMLHWGRYSDEQMKEETATSLHKWALLITAARIAKENKKKLMIIDCGNLQNLDDVLEIIEIGTGLKGMGKAFRAISSSPEEGIQLGDASNEQLYWVAGLYE